MSLQHSDDLLQLQAAARAMAASWAAARRSTGTAATEGDDSDEGTLPYWLKDGWRPLTNSGTQRSPNMIRSELQRYIDKSSETQTATINRMGVNSNSFRKFMNPKTYKNQWSAIQNGTYWAAAKMLEEERSKPATSKKRKTTEDCESPGTNKKSKLATMEMVKLLHNMRVVEGVSETLICDSCPDIVKKIKSFLAKEGITKKDFCDYALGGVNGNSLSRFLAAKNQDQAVNVVYRRAYVFFEKKRIFEGQAKSNARLNNEVNHPQGFVRNAPSSNSRWVLRDGVF